MTRRGPLLLSLAIAGGGALGAACIEVGEGSPLATTLETASPTGVDDGAAAEPSQLGDPGQGNDRGGGADRGDGGEAVPTSHAQALCSGETFDWWACGDGACLHPSSASYYDLGRCYTICGWPERYPLEGPLRVHECAAGWACASAAGGWSYCFAQCRSKADCYATDDCTPLDVTQPKLGAVCWPRNWGSPASAAP